MSIELDVEQIPKPKQYWGVMVWEINGCWLNRVDEDKNIGAIVIFASEKQAIEIASTEFEVFSPVEIPEEALQYIQWCHYE